jgi:hypothetical protein
LRNIYVDPHGRLLATTSTSRFHPQGLSSLLRAREQGICATTWCDAPVRHLDHVTPHAEGGPTSLDNGQGLCARCNHAKQAPGWRQKSTQREGRHAIETVTPTGHTYVSVAPTPPAPARASDTTQGRDAGSSRDVTPVSGTDLHQNSGAPKNASAASEGDRVQDPAATRERTSTPAWTPAVGVTGPAPGRIPRSRYSIGCQASPDRGAIAYRPSPPPRQPRPARQPQQRPANRAPGRTRHADLSWTHPT